MALNVRCPACGQLAQVADDAVGKQGSCPKCQQKFLISSPGAGAATAPNPGSVPTAPQPGAYQTGPPATISAYQYVQPPQASGMAISSLVLGIVSFASAFVCGFLAIPVPIVALVLGIVSLRGINRSQGQQSGKGMAIAGICLGAASLLIMILVMALVAVYVFGLRHERRW